MEELAKYEIDPFDIDNVIKIARKYFDRGQRELGLLFAKRAEKLDPENIEIIEMLSINCFYSKDRSNFELGHRACEKLSFNKNLEWNRKYQSRQNHVYYIDNITNMMPSTVLKKNEVFTEPKYSPMNPSINLWRGSLWMVQRTVNYIITPPGNYDMQGFESINTINYLIKLNDDLSIAETYLIKNPVDFGTPLWTLALGLEDARLLVRDDELYVVSTIRQLNEPGWCEMIYAKITDIRDGECQLADWRMIHPQHGKQHEKNWMHVEYDDEIRFIYSTNPTRIINDKGETVSLHEIPICGDFRGSSHALKFEGGYLAIIHESVAMPDHTRRYIHRFAWYNTDGELKKLSDAFWLLDSAIQFVAGMCWSPDHKKLIASFGYKDRESWLAVFEPDEIKPLLKNIETLGRLY